MEPNGSGEKQRWVTCLLSDMLLSRVKAELGAGAAIDYRALFAAVEGFETPADPESFLSDPGNWIPLAVLRELETLCVKLTGRKDFAYHAAKAYFAPGQRPLPSLFEIIVRVLNDVRSALIFANLWATAQTNYLKLQSFEKSGAAPELFILAEFGAGAAPGLAAIHLLRGFSEGFTRLYPFIEEARCVEEISQLRLEEVADEFPGYTVREDGDRLALCARSSSEPVVEARKIALHSETVPVKDAFTLYTPDMLVAPERAGSIEVLTAGAPPSAGGTSAEAYRIVKGGVLNDGPLAHEFKEGGIYGAPYCRFRFEWKESAAGRADLTADATRKEVSRLLFDHLKQLKQSHIRMAQFSTEKARLERENIRLRRAIEQEYGVSGMIGRSKPMQELFGLVRSIADTDVTVLIEGETGTGKELIARAIHYNGPRRGGAFIAVNCGALSETLLESELFGHEKGAFTGAAAQRKGIFEAAHGGTLFLDEIGETSAGTQVKLLRVLQEGELQRVGGRETIRVDVRVIAATNQKLDDLVKAGRFRQDLFYRLNVFPLALSPLRSRPEDIPPLVAYFIEKSNGRLNKNIRGATPAAMALLIAWGWPGNVRELENVVQRMMVVAKGEYLDAADLPLEMRGEAAPPQAKSNDWKETARTSSELIEKKAIADALAGTGGNVTRAAKALGVSRATLQNKMKAYGLRGKAS
ncbi:MAG TPA: sigma-54 dependent transcriptional regulator [Verrucomicrobiae bacterium]|nr:sigma-54 dependent transcriptional regulator [Verrucomicrobiae bacterium]